MKDQGKLKVDQRPLVEVKYERYLILTSDQHVVIDDEFKAMVKAIARKKTIIEMLPAADTKTTDKGLGNLLDELNGYVKPNQTIQ